MVRTETKSDREEKWRHTYDRFSGWDTHDQRHVQELEAETIAAWLLELDLPSYDILEVGCGNGYFGSVIIDRLTQANASFTYHFTDFLPECVEQTKKVMQDLDAIHNISFSTLDVYEIDSVFPKESQQIILSTGFVSPVTYRDALPKVAAVLKKDGVLICDFVNHFSPLVFFSHPISSIRKLVRTLRSNDPKARYQFGLLGIQAYCKDFQLSFVKHKTIRLRRNPLICMFQKQ